MKQRLKKAAAILLSAAMCAGTVAQAAPGAIATGPKAEGAAPVKDTEKETEKETKKESPEAGKKEYRVILPVVEDATYQVEEAHKSKELSNTQQEILLYGEGEKASFTVEGSREFCLKKAEGLDGSVFLDAEDIHDGKAEFTMPAYDLALNFLDAGKGTETKDTEIKDTEAKGTETKGTETKDTETKDTETEGTEPKALETKDTGTEAKAPETKAPETKVTETKDTETKDTEAENKSKFTIKVEGDAYANVYYGITGFDEALAHKGEREFVTDSYTLDLADVKDGKVWVYAQSTGELGYSGLSLPGEVEKKVLRSMPGMGGFIFYEFDLSEYEGTDGVAEFRFQGLPAKVSRALATKAAPLFNTSTRKKVSGVNLIWEGGHPTMYEPKPATGESGFWGSGTWRLLRPSIDEVFTLFGVEKPKKAKFTSVGTDGGNNIYMRCTGVADQGGDHSGLGAGDIYVQCYDADTSGSTHTYTFRVWAANGGRGQSTEGYFQISVEPEDEKPTNMRLRKTLKPSTTKYPTTDLLGNTRKGDLANAKFRVYKLNSTGLKRIEKNHNDTGSSADAWWNAHNGRASKKEILGYVEGLILKSHAKPGDGASNALNPNDDCFSVVASYATGPKGWTDRFPVDTGVKDYYIAFERHVPDGMNYGYDGYDGVPEGKHFFYKIFSVYDGTNIIAIDGEGGSENNTDDRSVTFEDGPVMTHMKLKKEVDILPQAKGLTWSDFEFFISDKADFSHKVTVKLTGQETTIDNFLVGDKYYLKENLDSPACRSAVGYVPDKTVYSFRLDEEGNILYSDTYPQELDDPRAVDAYHHVKFNIGNSSDEGHLKLIKVSSIPEIALNNKCYSLAGATYDIYLKTSPTAPNTGGTKKGTLVTDETGASNVLRDIPAGYYYAIETHEPKGFEKNEEPKAFVVEKGQTNKVEVKDKPLNDPIEVLLRKKDSETGEGSPQAGAALEGAEYTVNYYDGYYDTSEELADLAPFKSWVFRTDADGWIKLNDNSPISGGELYRDEFGRPTFPLGTISIQETHEPDGYKIDPTIYVYKLEKGSEGASIEAWNTPDFLEEPERGDFKFRKVCEDKPLADVPFKITSNTTGESHVLVTDADGVLDTSKAHSRNTNRGETAEDGVWFGSLEALDDAKGALLYDTYTVEELLCENNKDKFLAEPFTVTVDSDLADTGIKELDPVDNEQKEEPEIKTTATDAESQAHDAFVNEMTTLTDVVEYANLEVGKTYTVEGYLVLKETGEPLLDADNNRVTASKTFTVAPTAEGFKPTIPGSDDPRYGRGTVELTFTFDSSLLKGKPVVAFEDLYLEEFHVAEHADINDEGQTVTFKDPQLSTTATDKNTGKHYAPLEKEATIVDEVAYKDLIPGHTYTVKGILMDKAAKEALKVNGEPVEAEKVFVPEGKEGKVTLEYTLDATLLEDVSTVVYETLYYKDREVASHADIEDENQEVYFTDTKIGTTATDQETGKHEGFASEKTTLVDKVSYTGLIPGREYTVSGYLVLKDTGEPLLDAAKKRVEASKTFTPAEKDGSVDIVFTFDSSLLAGKSTVAFETIYMEKREVGVHADIHDKEQTVTFKKPEIGTTATEQELGGHEAFPGKKTTIRDLVRYKNLVPGLTYTLSGVLVDKKSGKPVKVDGKKVENTVEFTPETADGEVEVAFTLDSTKLAGKPTVVFETLYLGERGIAIHADLKDKGQTITFQDVQLRTKATNKADGKKELGAEKKAAVADTVDYQGLVPGKKYTVSGVLMDKETGKPLKVGGGKVEASKTFRAEKAKGSVGLTFTFDASALGGKTLVAFETLYYKEREIASHADLKDADQTVTVKKEDTEKETKKKDGGGSVKSPKTGDDTGTLLYMVLLMIAAAVVLDHVVRTLWKKAFEKGEEVDM